MSISLAMENRASPFSVISNLPSSVSVNEDNRPRQPMRCSAGPCGVSGAEASGWIIANIRPWASASSTIAT